MARIIVSFDSERDAQDAIDRLMGANIGEIRARVLDSSETMSYPKTESTSPMITPETGSVEVRPEEYPQVPEAMHDDMNEYESGVIPTTGGRADGVQVMIEVDDEKETQVRQIISGRE